MELIIAASILLVTVVFIGIMHLIISKSGEKSGIIPDYPRIPSPPPPKRTSETQYGKNLLHLAEKIYLSDLSGMAAHPDTKARLAVKKAHELLIEAEEHCNQIDEAKKTKSAKEMEEFFKSIKQSEG